MRDTAGRNDEVKGDAGDADEDWNSEGIVSVDEGAASGVCDKLRNILRLCKGERKTIPISVIEVIELSREVAKAKRNDAKLIDS